MSVLSKKIEVSCVILTYNSGEKLFKALASALSQKGVFYEIIVSDDGSEVFNREEICAYIEQRKNDYLIEYTVVHHKENIGTVKNYNSALRLVTGKYVIGVAADDQFVNDDILRKIANEFEESGADIIIGNAVVEDNKIIYSGKMRKYFCPFAIPSLYNEVAYENFISGAVTYYRTSFINKIGLFDERIRLIEDWPGILNGIRNDALIFHSSIITLRYSLQGISSVRKKSRQYLIDYINIIEYYILPKEVKLPKYTKRYNHFMKDKIQMQLEGKSAWKAYLCYMDVVVFKILRKVIQND